ncbi:hypothetical protein J2X55_000770 [Microbacterium sp. 1154]|uniref:hypothetical protein n=1 Tax=Microbacterium sp. 1154 TaxID=2817733 RepID=UPI002861A211|nr:hypothetical protein [Microbacterium sp. 1154]MDR6689871.1 hypothetical protein [Microbacterium sp. 1154]
MVDATRTAVRGALAWALVGVMAAALSGCFMIPLVDGRSPFDDPFGSSKSDIEKAIPPIQAALDASGADDGGLWRVVAEEGSDNCEGACQLRVEVSIEPADESGTTSIVSEDVLRTVLVTAVPVAEQHHVDLSVVPGYADAGYGRSADLSSAVEALFGDHVSTKDFTAFTDESYRDAEVRANTRERSNVLQAMGLG